MNLKKHFCITDGRPWYKQVVSGLYMFMLGAIVTPFVILAIAINVSIFTTYPLVLIATKVAVVLGSVIMIAIALFALITGWCWATEDWD